MNNLLPEQGRIGFTETEFPPFPSLCYHQAPAPAPRFESSECFPHGASGETKASCCTTSKWQIQLRRCRYPLSGGNGACAVGGMITPPKGSPQRGAPSGRFFGDFLIGEKVTRGAGRSARSLRAWELCSHKRSAEEGFALLALVGAGALGPCKKNRGEPQYPLHLYPETNKKLHPNVQPSNKKISPPRGKICAAQ